MTEKTTLIDLMENNAGEQEIKEYIAMRLLDELIFKLLTDSQENDHEETA